jgi:hypothetical protein
MPHSVAVSMSIGYRAEILRLRPFISVIRKVGLSQAV